MDFLSLDARRLRRRWAMTALLVASVTAESAYAQIGNGWVAYDSPSTIHLDGSAGIETYPGTSTSLRNEGASFTNEGGIETFALHDPISNRSERRMLNTYQGGRRQFEGEVRISPPTNDESVMQVFGGNSGATTQMIRAYNEGGGTLRKVPGAVLLADKVHGVWVKINVIHDTGANFVKTYVNGRLLATGDGEASNAGTDGWYHKYGCYGTLRTGSAKVEWRNVKHFRDGTAPAGDGGGDGGPVAPPPDASADVGATADTSCGPGGCDGGADAPITGSGGAGGSVTTGGAPGSGGTGVGGSGGGVAATGGRGGSAGAGTGGRAGSGGSSAGTGGVSPPSPGAEGCGCRVGAGSPGGGAAWGGFITVTAGLTLLRARARRRRTR